MLDTDRETTPDKELGGIAGTFAKVKEFLEVTGFNFGGSTRASKDSPTRKTSLSSWTNYYRSLVMKPGHIVQKIISRYQPMRDTRRRGTEEGETTTCPATKQPQAPV